MMKISVVTVCYNAASTLEQTMLSVLNQTYPDVEYIIIDGGSTDGSVDIIKKYADRLAYWVSEPDKGIYDAMNKGIKVATGEWINFMNAGDEFEKNIIIEKVFSDTKYDNIDVIYGDRVSKYSFGLFYQLPKELTLMKLCFPIFHQSTFIKTETMKLYKYELKYRISADYALFYKLYSIGKSFLYVNVPMSVCEVESGLSTLPQNQECRLKEDAILRGEKIGLRFKIRLFLLKMKQILVRIYCFIDKSYNNQENKRNRLLKSEYFQIYQ